MCLTRYGLFRTIRLMWLWVVYLMVLYIVPFALLLPFLIRPRSLIAALSAGLAVSVLLIWGMSAQPQSLPRIVMHLAAVLLLAAAWSGNLVVSLQRVTTGTSRRRRR